MPLFVCKNSSGLFLVCSRWGVTVCRFFDEQILSFILLMIKIFYLVSCVEPLNHPLAIGCFFLLSLSLCLHPFIIPFFQSFLPSSLSLSFNNSFLVHYLFVSSIHYNFLSSIHNPFLWIIPSFLIISFFISFFLSFYLCLDLSLSSALSILSSSIPSTTRNSSNPPLWKAKSYNNFNHFYFYLWATF